MLAHALKSRWAQAALAAALLAGLAGCAKVPLVGGKPAIQLSMEASDKCNTCGKTAAQPLEFAVLQVTDPAAITGTSLVQIWGKEKSLFGDALLTRDSGFVDPNTKTPFSYEKNPKTKAVIVVGNFCRPDGSCWYVVHSLRKGTRIKLRADASCLTVVKK
jgi:type VI secretion system VasD/TssJ family lipoprotein